MNSLMALIIGFALVPDPAVVKVTTDGGGFCSGVCISGDGCVLTAEHCGCRSGSEVGIEFPSGLKVKAKVIYDPPKNNTDEVTLLKIIDSPKSAVGVFPYHPIARTGPKKGDTIISRGYPQGHYTELKGTVTNTDQSITEATGLIPWYGNSGGPLFNGKDEVVGICSGYDESSGRWISWESIQTAVKHTGITASDKYVLCALVANDGFNCPPCEQFKDDTTNATVDLEIKLIKFNEREWSEFQVPTFWIVKNGQTVKTAAGKDAVKVGYTGMKDLRDWIHGTLRLPLSAAEAIEESVVPKPTPPPKQPEPYKREGDAAQIILQPPRLDISVGQPVPAPVVKDEPPAPVDPEAEWGGVTVVVAASSKVPSALRAIEARVKRAILNASHGKARIEIIAESTNPEHFAEYEKFAGPVETVHATILIPRSIPGLAAGILLRQVESKVHDVVGSALSKFHVEELFERINPDDYSTISELAETADAPRPQADGTNSQSLVATIVSVVGSLLGGMSIGGWIKGLLHRRAAAKIDAATSKADVG